MILVGVSGGIAAIKCPEIVLELQKCDPDVRVIMTQSATKIIPPGTFKHVYVDLFDGQTTVVDALRNRRVDHIDLANSASIYVIVPATANVIAKLAGGIADDYLTTTALAATCPVLVCPSMNVYMWNHPATKRNMQLIRDLGYHTFGPDNGMLACGYEGEGRLPDVSAITAEIVRFVNRSTALKGKKIIITAGGTTEPIDDIRQITNKSSGKMGVAIAQACYLRGADVLLLRSVSSVSPRYPIHELLFDTADSLQSLLKTHVPKFDICFHVAAVSDFRVREPQKGKISGNRALPLELEPRMKILDTLKTMNPNITVVAFKAEFDVSDEDLVRLAKKRITNGTADCIIANDVGRSGIGFQSDQNEVWVIQKNKNVLISKRPKLQIADSILDELTESNFM